MGWEQRRGQKFFYQSVCVDGVHRKKYLGKGVGAESVARQIDERRQRRVAVKQAVADDQARTAPADEALAAFRELAGLLFQASLLVDGFHLYHGQWRRRRVRIDQD